MAPRPRTDTEALLAHAGWMRALAVGLLRDAAAADDVVQDATVAALLHAPAGDAGLEAWLSRVVRNFAFRRRRGEARRAEHEARADPPRPEPSAAETLERLDLQRTLVEAVRSVEEPFRTTLVLRYFEGKSSAEIARTQGVPAGTVRWRLKRGLEELRERLDARLGSRQGWMALLAAPSLWDSPGGGSAVATSKFLTGVLAMKTAQLAATAVALVVVGGFAWWGFGGSRDQAGDAAGEGSQPAGALASVDLDSVTVPAPETPMDAAAARAGVAAEALPVAPPPAPAEDATANIEARFVDEHGTPWNGVRLAARGVRFLPGWDPGEGVLSGPDGRAVLAIAIPMKRLRGSTGGELKLELFAARAGCGTIAREATVRPGETVHLGDIVLGLGVRILGRTVDEDGAGVAFAKIGLAPAELTGDESRTARHGSDAFSKVPSTQSGTDGTFLLEGVSPGTLRVWAHAEGMRFAWSAPIEVPRDRDVLALELVLKPLLATDRIAGRVVGPDDAPIANANLWFQERHGGYGIGTSFSADAQGRFDLLVEYDDSDYEFTAMDPQDRLESATIEKVLPGTLDAVIRLQEKRWLRVHVSDVEGGAIEDASFVVRARVPSIAMTNKGSVAGEYSIPLPTTGFQIEIRAGGFRTKRLGTTRAPLDPASLPAVLEAVMQRASLVHGRVTAGGAPVAGATVMLLGDNEAATLTVAGYRSRYMLSGADETTTDAEGRFRIDCDEDRGFWLRVSAEGWAASEVGPLDAGTLGLDIERDVELTRGGAIEGTVLLPDGRDGEGTIVAFNHGDGAPRTLRAGPKGHYRVEGLTIGKWQVLHAQVELDPARTEYSGVRTTAPMEWSCEVRVGQTTRFDLDLSKP